MNADPYSEWLGLPPGPRPPDHYALLGLPRFGDDAAAAERAARERLARLDRYALHPDVAKRDACHRLMNEVARARVVLVSPARKRAYDAQLAQALGVVPPTGVPAPSAAVDEASGGDMSAEGEEAEAYLDDLARAAHEAASASPRRRGTLSRGHGRAIAWGAASFLVVFALGTWLVLRAVDRSAVTTNLPRVASTVASTQSGTSGPQPRGVAGAGSQANPTTTRIASAAPASAQAPPRAAAPFETPALLRTASLSGPGVYSLEWNADATRLIAIGNNRIIFFDPRSGTPIGPPLSFGDRPPELNQLRTGFVDRSGKSVATLSDGGENLRLWDIATRQQVGPTIHHPTMFDADLSPDDGEWVTADAPRQDLNRGGTAPLWDAATGRQIGATPSARFRIETVRFSPNGAQVVTASADGTARVWDARTGTPIGPVVQYPQGDWPQIAIFRPSGGRVVSLGRGGELRAWEPATGREVWRAKMDVLGCTLRYSPDGRMIAAGGDARGAGPEARSGCQVFDADTGTPLTRLLWHDASRFGLGPEVSLAFSPDGRFLVSTSRWDRFARLWDLRARGAAAGPPLEHPGQVCSALFDPSERRLFTACTDGNLRTWDLAPTAGAPPPPPPLASAAARPQAFPASAPAALPLDAGLAKINASLNQLTNWTVDQGVWDFIADGKLRGDGASDLDFDPDLPGDATFSFRMCVVKGMRPRIHFDGPNIYVGNEGYSKNLTVYGKVKDLTGDKLDYNNGDEIAVSVAFVGDDRFEVHLNDHVLTGTCLPHKRIHLRLSGGDWWSKGTTDFWDMRIGHSTASPAAQAAPPKTPGERLFGP